MSATPLFHLQRNQSDYATLSLSPFWKQLHTPKTIYGLFMIGCT